ncbi:ATP-binding protein [Pseudodesulfovibrio sp. zrk46]|uniref:PAS domain-containing sensor histidine kinase n=1 Tax=Pseudodesulfovibrio sp. zrk46 TaxID=2725288 RepID=UPI0014493D6B|nr:ATP-binding protein [Pseudodesulfovibrio sp. zrk46]QJB55248.1 PAS domain-containing protein [Pseudodesulfovibrio sp. zrk46]
MPQMKGNRIMTGAVTTIIALFSCALPAAAHDDLITPNGDLIPYLLMAFVVAAIITLALLYFNRVLKRGIERRTGELKRNQESLRQVIDLMPNMIHVKNREGRFLLINRTMADSLGSTVDELTGSLHSDVHPNAKEMERIREDDMVVFDNGFPQVKMEEPYHFVDGSIHWLQTTRLPYTPADSDEPAVLTLAVDITRRKEDNEALQKSQDELQKLNEELEQRVEERTASLAAAKEELMESLDQLKQTQEELILSEKLAALGGLVAGVAHEINTPLGVGVTAGSFLSDNLKDMAKRFDQGELKKSDLEKFIETGTESSKTLMTNLNRAAELIRSFKQVAADQSSELRRPFNLREYVDEALLSLRPKYKRTGHVIENHCPDIEIDSYPGAFMQIITNLLVNALIHAYDEDDYGHIVMDGTVENDKLVFTFKDDGKGMDNNTMDKAFEPFYTTKREKGGTGLGLHIVFNTVTQTLGGTVRMTSEPGKGTEFTITMPLSEKTV